ncbi:hypothetical protein BDF21DRAFT_466980 [Thamnidium elegans]|uniref:Amine oxidase domain-containing protein n=1 Tax=Thamnidium elegans TaxID=101142 RepID=A0A8H7SH25_9FUNG|nr:hypothetical protein INT48_005346 [Thamnidium elegans]KAI8063086.1 hypothetical protein BDF21DRAFT_466980 [Thamnidium elegans]
MYKILVLVILLLLDIVESRHIKTKVVILGAGAAGISAAKTFSELELNDFIILDAQSFIGGRVQHAEFGSSQVELGANWIYGKGQNPIYKLALDHGLKTVPNDKTNLAFFDERGKLSDQNQGTFVYNEFESIKIKLVNYAEQRKSKRQVDLSSRLALNLLGWKPDTPLKAAVEYFNIDWEFSEPAEMCSLEYATGIDDTVTGTYPFGNEFVVDSRGFNHILKEESKTFLNFKDSRLMLNTLVTKVSYNDHNVTVYTSNGDIIEAEYAICTFSLGVLQSDTVEFNPIFPEWKREALLSFHMTTYTKVFLKFESKFWQDWQFALYANNVTQHGSYYTVWQNLNAPGYLFQQQTDNILMVTTTDMESRRIERMTDTQVKQEIMQVIQRMFGVYQEPTDILIPRWHQHPLFRGSYSNWPIGALKKHHLNMRAPLKNTLWFAGEAMSADFYGFLHGAWFEGEYVANIIVRCLSNSSCPRTEMYKYVTGCDERKTPKFLHQQLY